MGSLEVGINRSVARPHPQQRLLIGCCVVAQNRTVNCAAKVWSRWPVRFASWKRRRAGPFDFHNTAVKLSGFNRCRTQHPVKRRHLPIALRVQCLPSSNQQFEEANIERRNRIRARCRDGTQICNLCGQRSFTPLNRAQQAECLLAAQGTALCSIWASRPRHWRAFGVGRFLFLIRRQPRLVTAAQNCFVAL